MWRGGRRRGAVGVGVDELRQRVLVRELGDSGERRLGVRLMFECY